MLLVVVRTLLNRRRYLLHYYPFSVFNKHLVDYPTPFNFNYFWGFGSLAGLALFLQLVTGVFLAMFYAAHIDLAFNSVERIMRDISNGWFVRYSHAVGASLFFAVVYIHMARGLYYGSYSGSRRGVWFLGLFIFVVMMATAFMGYVLPWGQMSFRGATVITNLFTAIPYVGELIVSWLWGGFSVGNATLNRFFSLHYLLPFVIVGGALVHILVLHFVGSGNPLGFPSVSNLPFYPYFYVKDLVGAFFFFCFFFAFVFFYPNYLGHPDNYIEANALVTPIHIVPEWYFLPFYAILRSVPSKLGGVVLMALSLLILLLLPYLTRCLVRGARFLFLFRIFFWSSALDFFLLGWLGSCPAEGLLVTVAQFLTAFYFLAFLVVLPLLSSVEYAVIEGRVYEMLIDKNFFAFPLLLLFDLIFVVGLLVAIAYFTLLERKVMASVQRRVGPNVVGFYGVLQPLVDGVKLLNKEVIVPQRANRFLFLLAPLISLFLALVVWAFLPFSVSAVLIDVELSLLYVFLLSSLNVYGLILAGWSSNSKYAFLGALRSGAQVISYELVFGFIVVLLGFFCSSYNLVDFLVVQSNNGWLGFVVLPIFSIFFVIMLAETNRAPFDLAEAEAEIVAGYNVEYSSIVFALFFLAEYANMMAMSVLAAVLFLGGGAGIFGFSSVFFFFTKVAIFLVAFILTRSALPRYRYDQLMSLGWKVLLPFSFSYIVFFSGLVTVLSFFGTL